MTEDKMWTIEGLKALTDTVQNEELEYRGKTLTFQFCELTEEEEPQGAFKDDFKTEEDRMSYYQEIGTLRVIKMIEKANEKNPDGATLNHETWTKLPTTLRYQIANKIMGMQADVKENFTMG